MRHHSDKLSNGNTIHYKISPDGTYYRRGMTFKNGKEDKKETPDDLVAILEECRILKTVVRVFTGDEAGRSWLEEWDVAGIIGRSMGPTKIPLIVLPGAHGGGALLDHCIIRVDCLRRGMIHTLWKHPGFHVPKIKLRMGSMANLPYEAWVLKKDGKWEDYARFKTKLEYETWFALINGDRFPDKRDFKQWKDQTNEE